MNTTPTDFEKRTAAMILRIRPTELGAALKSLVGWRRKWVAVDGFDLFVDSASNFGSQAISPPGYEPTFTRLITEFLVPGDTFIDLGANEGWFALNAARQVGSAGRVLAIEPQARLWPVILQNSARNRLGWITLVPMAVDAIGEISSIEMVLTPSTNTGSSSAVASWRSRFWPRQQALVTSIDAMTATYGVASAKLMKVDIEGFEYQALQSAAGLLGRRAVQHLLVETHPRQLAALGQSEAAVVDLLRGHGYKAREIHERFWHFTA